MLKIKIERWMDSFAKNIVLVTLITSGLMIAIAISYRFTGIYYLTGGQILWLFLSVLAGYILSVIYAAFSDQMFPHEQAIQDIYLILIRFASPFVMLLTLIFMIIDLISGYPKIHIHLVFFSFAGFFIFNFREKDNMKEEYNHINATISQRRDSDDRIL